MEIKKIIYSTLLIIVTLQAYSQKNKIEAADKKYDRFAYFDAIATYERVAAKGYKDEKMFQKLANAYYFSADLKKAATWYKELFDTNIDQEPEYYYRYSQCLKSIGEYDKSDKMLLRFILKSGNEQRAILFINQKNYLEEIKSNSGRFDIEDLAINSEFSDYGSSFLGNNLVFASARDTGGVSKKVFKWNNQSFTNLYSAEQNTNGNLGEPKRFDKKINSKLHESTPVFTKDGKTMYFTRNNFLEGKKQSDSQNSILLKLYKATFDDNSWKNITELPFNSNQYSVAHPMLSPDEKTLYFASDMPGTLGQSDLFKVNINQDGTFGSPINLGATVNTEGRETFPFINENNELYFSSDGRPGLGGLDVFVADIDGSGVFKKIQNVGEPINSPQDDFAFIMKANTRNGFFTSNRPGGKGYDDIYKFAETRKLICEQILEVIITDKETRQILTETKLGLYDDKFQLVKEAMTDVNGQFNFQVECGKTYYIRAQKDDFLVKESPVTIANKTEKTTLPLDLEKRIKIIEVGTDLAVTLDIPMIYFDLNKSVIRKDAAFELEKILAVMIQYPKMIVDIRSHTDSRQTAKYNEELSDRRANSTRMWLINNGIEPERLTAKGYGESQLINKCADGVECTEEEHQLNRRSEFIVISME